MKLNFIIDLREKEDEKISPKNKKYTSNEAESSPILDHSNLSLVTMTQLIESSKMLFLQPCLDNRKDWLGKHICISKKHLPIKKGWYLHCNITSFKWTWIPLYIIQKIRMFYCNTFKIIIELMVKIGALGIQIR